MQFSEETKRRIESAWVLMAIASIVAFIGFYVWVGKNFDYKKKQPSEMQQELQKK